MLGASPCAQHKPRPASAILRFDRQMRCCESCKTNQMTTYTCTPVASQVGRQNVDSAEGGRILPLPTLRFAPGVEEGPSKETNSFRRAWIPVESWNLTAILGSRRINALGPGTVAPTSANHTPSTSAENLGQSGVADTLLSA